MANATGSDHARSRVGLIALLLAIIAGYLIGTQAGADNAAFADKIDELLKEKELVPVSIVPPAVAVPKGGWAVVGAADDRYYIVREDGTTLEVKPDRREYLIWR